MSLARYLSKLGALLNSSGQVPAAGIADGAVTAAKLAAGAVSNAYVGGRGQVFTSNGTFTIPTGITAVKVTVVAGGGSGTGGGGGAAVQYFTGLTSGNTLAVTVGGVGGASSVASGTQTISTVSATAGGASAGGAGSGGVMNISGRSQLTYGSGISTANCTITLTTSTYAGFSIFGSSYGAGGQSGVVIFEW